MGITNGTVEAHINGTPEEQAVAQLKLVFENIDMGSDKAVDRNELQMALQKNDKLRALIVEAKLNLDSTILEQLDTNKDGRVTWEELESHLKQAATVQAENKGRITAGKDDIVNKEGLEGERFKTLLVEAGLWTAWELLEQVGANADKQITWDKFYDKLKVAAEAEVRATGDLTLASDGASTAATEINIEDEAASKRYCC